MQADLYKLVAATKEANIRLKNQAAAAADIVQVELRGFSCGIEHPISVSSKLQMVEKHSLLRQSHLPTMLSLDSHHKNPP